MDEEEEEGEEKSERKRGSKRVRDRRGGPVIDSHTLRPPPPSLDPWTLPMSDSSRLAKLYGVCGLPKIAELTKLRADAGRDDKVNGDEKKKDDIKLRGLM